MKRTDYLWKAGLPIYQQILQHPFNVELMKGTLDEEAFKHYLIQDSLYLIEFSRALALFAAKASDTNLLIEFIELAKIGLLVEKSLHDGYLSSFGVEDLGEPSPVCFMYTQFLLSRASLGNVEEAIAAFLPCFWIYREVGYYIYRQSTSNNPYQKWVDTYAGEEFNQVVEKVIDVAESIAQEVSGKAFEKMQKTFLYSCRLEYLFWDSAYRQESWIV